MSLKETHGGKDRHNGEGNTKLESCGHKSRKPRIPRSHTKLEETRKDSPLEPSDELGFVNTLILNFTSPEV